MMTRAPLVLLCLAHAGCTSASLRAIDGGGLDGGSVGVDAARDASHVDSGDAGSADSGPGDAGDVGEAGLDAGPPDGGLLFYDDFDEGAIAPWEIVGGEWSIEEGALVAGPSCFWSGTPCAGGESPILIRSPPLPVGDREYALRVDFRLATDVSDYHVLRFGITPAYTMEWNPPEGGVGGSFTPWRPDTLMLVSANADRLGTPYANLCARCVSPAGTLFETWGGIEVGTWYSARIDVCATELWMEIRRRSDGGFVWSRRADFDARTEKALSEMYVVVLGEGPGHSVDNVSVERGCRR